MRTAATPPSSAAPSLLYRRVWRWHFYAGLLCLPLLVTMAVTGGLYLFKPQVESLLYARLQNVPVTGAPMLPAASLVEHARAAVLGVPVRFTAPRPGRSAEVDLRTADGAITAYLDPSSGALIGTLSEDRRLMEIVKRIHSMTIAGVVANHGVEVVAGWAIVLVVSGVFLWWPRGRRGGVLTLRERPARRVWWRDLHAVTGIVAAAAVLFLAVTGMPWSAFWGKEFSQLTNQWGVGLPRYVFGPRPQSSLASVGEVPWALTASPMPMSMAHAEHEGHEQAEPAPPPATPLARDIGLDEALRRFARLGLPPGTPVALPAGPRGVYTAMRFPDDVRGQRVVHLDRYSGAVLADVGYRDYGAAARATSWGVSLHTGLQFGWPNQLVMLAGCVAIVLLAVSSLVMWWKRRPRGRLAAPPRQASDRAAIGAITVAVLLGVLYPLLGASMLVALAADALVPEAWHRRLGL